MTPEQLRTKAWSEFRAARLLLDAGMPDQAARHANLLVELSLKARYCTQNGIADLPADPKDLSNLLKSRGLKPDLLKIHHLERLLTLAGGEGVKHGALLHVDWERALQWFPNERYTPDGAVTKEQAADILRESWFLAHTLALYEIIDNVVIFEKEWEAELGLFNLVVVYRDFSDQYWVLLLSAHWFASATDPRYDRIMHDVNERMPQDLLEFMPTVERRSVDDQLSIRFRMYFRARHEKRGITARNNVAGFPMPAAYIITNMPWSVEQVREDLESRGLPFEVSNLATPPDEPDPQ